MASIRLHGDRWQARVRRKGHPEESRCFATRIDAERWARAIESEIDRGSYTSATESQRLTLRELIDRYVDEVLPSMKGTEADGIRLRALQRRPSCSFSLLALTPARVDLHACGAGAASIVGFTRNRISIVVTMAMLSRFHPMPLMKAAW